MEVVVDDGLVGDEVLAEEDIGDGHIDAEGLDVKTHLLDHDVMHISDVLF